MDIPCNVRDSIKFARPRTIDNQALDSGCPSNCLITGIGLWRWVGRAGIAWFHPGGDWGFGLFRFAGGSGACSELVDVERHASECIFPDQELHYTDSLRRLTAATLDEMGRDPSCNADLPDGAAPARGRV